VLTAPAMVAEDWEYHPRTLIRAIARAFSVETSVKAIVELAPLVALGFPEYGPIIDGLAEPGEHIVGMMVDSWTLGRARVRDPEGAPALVTVVPPDPRLRDPQIPIGPRIQPHVIHQDGALELVMEPPPTGVPLTIPMLPLRPRDALPVLRQLLDIVALAGTPLRALTVDSIYVHDALEVTGVLAVSDAVTVRPIRRSLQCAAPEILAGGAPSHAGAVFSACAAYHFAVHRRGVYRDDGTLDVDVPGILPAPVKELVERALDVDPAKRPTASELIAVLDGRVATN
jgi:serine/threonine protein kinase